MTEARGADGSNHPPGEQIRSLRDRIVSIEEERRAAAETIRGIYKEAAEAGLNKRALRELVRHELETVEQREAREDAEAALASMQAALDALDDFSTIATFGAPKRPQ